MIRLPHVELRPVQIALGEDGAGLLVLIDEWLVAILVRLAAAHGPLEGHWFMETGYGRFSLGEPPTFSDEKAAVDWFRSSAADRRSEDF